MDFLITEVQMLSAVLTALITIVLLFFLPNKKKAGKVFNTASKMLAGGTFLITIHFVIQYTLHKTSTPSPVLRTIINLSFGIPLSYFLNLSILYLQRRCAIKKWEWLFAPLLFVIAIMVLSIAFFTNEQIYTVHQATIVMSLLYATSLIVYRVLQIIEYFKIKKMITQQMDNPLEELNRWTKWVILVMAIVNIGMPIMTFNTNLELRSIYGLVSLIIFYFAVFNFMGYGFYSASQFVVTERKNDEDAELQVPSQAEKLKLDTEKIRIVEAAAEKMVNDKYFLKTGINMKDVSDYMGISRNMLNMWLQSTDYKQFNRWLMTLRIEEAKKIIVEHPDWSNETIASACGFCDRSYFQRQFRSLVGVTPTKWGEDINASKS